jgi:hypothetical protein
MLYKYRDLRGDGFKYFVDIILNNRLYAADWRTLNDPMEGTFVYLAKDVTLAELLKEKKSQVRVCSLTSDCENKLMWAHYADGNRGVVIEVEIDSSKYDIRKMKYDGITDLVGADNQEPSAEELLSHKLSDWDYEKEERVFVKDSGQKKTNHAYVNVKVKQIILGSAMCEQEIESIRRLINSQTDIEVIEQQKYRVYE